MTREEIEHLFVLNKYVAFVTSIATGIIVPSINSQITPQDKYIEFPKTVLITDTVIGKDTLVIEKKYFQIIQK